MARARDEGLDIDVFHAKGRLRLGPAALEGALKVRRVADNPRAAPAATGEGLDDHRLSVSREADEECSRVVEADAAVDAPRYRDAGCNGRRSSAGLVPEQRQMLDLGADEGDARGSAPFRELGALGEESITWVDCVAAIRKRRLDHRVHVYSMGDGGPAAEIHLVERTDLPQSRQGAGSVHHVAFRTPDMDTYHAWTARLKSLRVPFSGEVNRFYFHSLYFREPNGILFEIATDLPGFDADEPMETLGEKLALPPFLEPKRAKIEAGLKPL